MKTENPKAWFFVLPVLFLVAFNALVPIMTVVNYSVQETFGNNLFFWQGLDWFEQIHKLNERYGPYRGDIIQGNRRLDLLGLNGRSR